MKWAPVVLLLLSVLLTSCSLLDSETSAIKLETDRDTYDLIPSETINVQAKNASSSVIYFSTCMPTTLEELDDKRVVGTLGFPVCECMCRAELEPGESWSYAVSVGWIAQHKDQLQLEGEGRYRLRLTFFEDKDLKRLLEEESLYTNRFKIAE